MSRPASYPDRYIYPHDFDGSPASVTWDLRVLDDGDPVDLSSSLLTAPVYDNGNEVGALTLGRDQDQDGVLKFALSRALFDGLGRYSKWYLREGTLFDRTLIQGTIVKSP